MRNFSENTQIFFKLLVTFELYWAGKQKGRDKFALCTIFQAQSHEDAWWSGGISSPFLTSALGGDDW
jgi:hypothetical protein